MTAARRIAGLAWGLALLVAFLAPYSSAAHRLLGTWTFLPSSAALLGLLWIAPSRREAGVARVGLSAPAPAWSNAVVVAVVAFAIARFATGALGEIWRETLEVVDRDPATIPPFVFQALNEELVLGWLPLRALLRRWPDRPLHIALGTAVVFGLLHVALYGLGELQTWLRPTTVLTLIAVGVLRCALILRSGHILLAWGLHAGWNLGMFRSLWRDRSSGTWLDEAQLFDVMLGNGAILAIASAAAGWACWRLARGPRSKPPAPTPAPRASAFAPENRVDLTHPAGGGSRHRR